MRKHLVGSIAIAVGLTVGVSSPADAQTCSPGGGTPNAGPFCIDGIITTNDNSGVPPQALFTADDNASKEFGAVNGNHTKVGVINFPTPPFAKPGNPPVLGDESITDKVNLLGVYTQGAVATDGSFWFYYAWTRATTSGSGFMAVEFQRDAKPVACSSNLDPLDEAALIEGCNPWANRDGDGTSSNSDFMILWDQTGNAIGPQNIFVRFYNKSLAAFGPPQNLTLAGSAVALYGLNDSSKGEMALNFSAIVGGGQNECITFANILPTTVTGNSDTADYKDTILSNFPIASNCGIVTVKKVTVPASTGINFQYTLDRDVATDQIFGVASPDTDCSVAGSSLFTCIGTLQHDQTDTISDVLGGTNYTLVESDKPGNYGLTSIICTTAGGTAHNITAGGTFPVEATKTTACVITNTLLTANLIVIKVVNNNFGLTAVPGDFSFTKEGGAAQPFANGGVSCSSGATCKTFTYNVGDAYAIAETATLPVGYTKVSEVGCSGTMTVLGGTCTITNQDSIAVPTLFTRMRIILHDRATIGGIRAGGSTGAADNKLTIRLYSDSGCTTEVTNQVFNVTADGTVTTSPGHTIDFNAAVDPAQNLVFRWRAFYSGNSFNQPQSTLCSDEAINLNVFQK